MAAGKPVVSTPVHDVQAMFGDIVALAADAPGFIDACRHALAESAGDRVAREARMRARVARHSWDAAAEQIRRSLNAVMATRRASEEDGAGPAVVAHGRVAAVAGAPRGLRKVASAG